MRPRLFRLLLLFILLPVMARADIAGPVKVIDGDTIEVAGQRLRLYGVDAPEADQTCRNKHGKPYDCGTNAIRTLALIIGGKKVSCVEQGKDEDGTVLAVCRLGRFDLGMQMVQMGWALAAPETGQAYRRAELAARAVPEGIWKGGFDTPWDWRRR